MNRIIVLLIVITVVALSAKFPHLMLNPGELSEGHQKIKNECTACHKPFWGIENTKCIACHKPDEIGKDTMSKGVTVVSDLALFHSKLMNQECASCHTDHKGTHPPVGVSRFDHEQLSAEQRLNCNGCHVKPNDKLHEQLSATCTSCHNTSNWKSQVKFDHSLIIGPNKSNCSSCHQKPSDTLHEKLDSGCERCHGTGEWKPATFDHASYFVLDKHHNVACSTCHSNNNFNSYTCYGCHEHQEGKIIRKHNEEGMYSISDCASCHRSGDEHDIRPGSRNRNMQQQDMNRIKEYIKKDKHEKGDDDE